MIEEILTRMNLKYEELTKEEKDTLVQWTESLTKSTISLEQVKTYIRSMRDAVENELCKHDLGRNQDLYLKARLRNYMLLEALLSTPDKAKEAAERAIAGLVSKK